MSIKQYEPFLQTALGSSRTFDAFAADQIYLSIAYNWKQRWNQKLAPMVKKLQTSVLSYANPRGFQIHEPDCLSFVESVDLGVCKMISQLQKSTCQEFVEQFFATRNTYSKYDSEQNRPLIVERVVSFGTAYPSVTAVKRACLELVEEG